MGRPGPPRDLCTATWKWFREQPSLRGLHGGSVSHFSCGWREKGARGGPGVLFLLHVPSYTKLGGGAQGEEMQP